MNAEHPSPALPTVFDGVYLPDGKPNVFYLLKNAELLFAAREFNLARTIYREIMKAGEYTALCLSKIAYCYEAEGRIQAAIHHFEEAIAFQPDLETYQKLATLLTSQGKDLQAAEIFERALFLKDLSPQMRFEFYKSGGNCWTRANRPHEAEQFFLKAIELDPSADDIRSNLGVLYLQSGKFTEAVRHFQDALASHPNNSKALSGLGSCYLAQGEKRLAHDSFVKSLSIEINNPTAIYYLVKCAYDIKVYSTAAKLLQEYIEIAPINANLVYCLAGLQFHLGRMKESKHTAQKVLSFQPDHLGAKELLTQIHKYGGSSG